jgi:hypothetical protein
VWQSLQALDHTMYLPRSICAFFGVSAASPANGKAATAAENSTNRIDPPLPESDAEG